LPADARVVDDVLSRVNAPRPKIHHIYESGDEYLQRVREMTMFLGVKLHSVILAMCAGVPSVMIEYAPKCRDFMCSMGVDRHSLHITDATTDALQAHIEDLLSRRIEV